MSDALRAGLSLTPDELELVQHQMKTGELPRDTLARHAEAAARNTFGFDHKTGRDGKPIEQGFGSALQPSHNSIDAYKKYCSHEPDFFGERQLVLFDRP